jgi:uncharacterized membrane protein (DUF373 family)
MPSEEEIKKAEQISEKQGVEEGRIQALMAIKAEEVMNVLQLIVVYILVFLFAIAVVSLGSELFSALISGAIFEPANVIAILETALLLFLVVEVFRTSIAHLEGMKVLPLVIDVGIIGVVRSLITFRVGKYESNTEALVAAVAYAALLAVLMGAFYVVHKQERKEQDEHPKKD